jgi:hypothetical protein
MGPSMTPPIDAARARRARIAVSMLFFSHGAIAAAVFPRLPAIKETLGLTNAELGIAVAGLPIGGLLAGGLAGAFIVRAGSPRVAVLSGVAAAFTLAAIGLASSWAMLFAAYLVYGMFDATMDAAMNTHGLGVQRVYGRSILQRFHGLWSVGGMTAGAAGAITAGLAIAVAPYLLVMAVVLGATVLAAYRLLLPAAVADVHPATDGVAEEPVNLRHAGRLLRVLGPIAMLGILCIVLQSAASIWGAVYLTDVLGTAAGIAGAGFVVFITAMAVGRLTNDRWVDRFGGTDVVRVGAVIAGAGVLAAMIADPLGLPLLAFVGFGAIGYGSASFFPVMILAAGSRPGIPTGHAVALAAWLVRLGLIFAPTAIGLAADEAGLAVAFAIPLAAAVAIGVFAVPLTGAIGRIRTRTAAAA